MITRESRVGSDALDVPVARGPGDGHLGDLGLRLQRLEGDGQIALAVDDRRLHAVVSATELIGQEGTVLA